MILYGVVIDSVIKLVIYFLYLYYKVEELEFSKLRLLGFKSFVDPVEIEILPGLTGIVGPNGCGKSNLLEALRWVMGENRPSSMRSGGMDDVIFAGAGSRPPKNFAEVVLGLQNAKVNSLDVTDEIGKIEVIRRVTRDIGSSYRLNGKDIQTKEMSMLFADSSTGAHSPSLVRQGQIAELINANPKSRRRLLEEAAGISGLYQRRHEAELKLKSSEGNMLRLQDVIEQLEIQIRILEKQARQAARYRELAEDIRTNEAYLFCKKWFDATTKLAAESDELVIKVKVAASAEMETSSAGKKRDEVESELPSLRSEETRTAAAFQRLIVEKEGIEKENERAENNILNLQRRNTEISNDFARQSTLVSDAKEVIERLTWEKEQLTKLSQGHDKNIESAQLESTKAAKKLSDDETKLDNNSEDFARLSARYQNIERQIEKAKNDLDKAIDELNQSDDHIIKLEADKLGQQEILSKKSKHLQNCKKDSTLAEKSLQNTEKVRAEAADQELQKRVDFSKQEGKLAALEAEKNALQGLIFSSSGETEQIFDQVRISKGFEAALGAAFSDDFKAPVIFSNEKTGWFELPDLKEIFELPVGALPIAQKVTAPRVLERRLATIGLVNSVDGPRLQKLLKAGQKLVSKEGNLWRWDGYCCMAEGNLSEAALRLKQENRLLDLNTEISLTRKNLDEASVNLEAAHSQFKNCEQASAIAREVRRSSDEKLSEASRAVNKVESELSIVSSKLYSLKENLSLRKNEREYLETELLGLNEVFEALGDLEVMRHSLEEHRSTVDQSRLLMVEKRALFDQARRDADSRLKRIAELDIDLKNWDQRLGAAHESMVELEIRKMTASKELEVAELIPNTLIKRRESLIELLMEADLKKVGAAEILSKKESEFRTLVSQERDCGRKASELREDAARSSAIKENYELNLEELRKSIKEEMSNEPEDLLKTLPIDLWEIPNVSEIEIKLHKLKNYRDGLGAVNLRADEDSKELSEECESLLMEKEDLENAIKKLRVAIIKLNSEGRSRLLEAFEEVNKNFGELFKNLFGGGMAELTFIESDDPLDAGLEIICQPPGKKLATLSLLSGGEQTLTALALIFSVFKANPSPICVLDEVDAPLDDANVERFCGLLDEMTRTTDTRFMIITHHPLSMSRMDRLYGITMVERGVSQLVSVDLKRAEELLEV